MGTNPINLIFRFLLELTALIAMGMWGWKLSDNWTRIIFSIAIPIFAMVIWGTFAVPNDPSKSGGAIIQVPGFIRLLIEFTFFYIASWMLKDIGLSKLSLWLAFFTLFHYVISYDRIIWLLSK